MPQLLLLLLTLRVWLLPAGPSTQVAAPAVRCVLQASHKDGPHAAALRHLAAHRLPRQAQGELRGQLGGGCAGGGAASGDVGAVQRRDVGDSFRAAEGGCRRALRRKEQRSP